MRRYLSLIIPAALQLIMFYIFPLFAGPTDAMGMVFIILLSSIVLGLAAGALSGSKLRVVYPVAVALLFIPSIPIHYNSSALIHSAWYFVLSAVGTLSGSFLRWLFTHK